MKYELGDIVRIREGVCIESPNPHEKFEGRICTITKIIDAFGATVYEVDNCIMLTEVDIERIGTTKVNLSFSDEPIKHMWISDNNNINILKGDDVNMKIRIKKMRDNAKLPEFKNGNWMDTYISLAGFVSQNHEDCDDYEVRGEFTFDDVVWWDEENKTYSYCKGDILVFKLGFALELPKGKELHLLPRSGTFRKYGLILTNSMGIGDDTFIGDNDEYLAMMYATREGSVSVGDRLIQMKIEDAMPEIELIEVEEFGNKDRGGYGSTGK